MSCFVGLSHYRDLKFIDWHSNRVTDSFRIQISEMKWHRVSFLIIIIIKICIIKTLFTRENGTDPVWYRSRLGSIPKYISFTGD